MTFFTNPNIWDIPGYKYSYEHFQQVANSVVKECDDEEYTNKNGEKVKLQISESVANTEFIDHNAKISLKKIKPSKKGEIQLIFSTTIGAGYKLVVEEGYEKTIALNFANPIQVGGGFLYGSRAQEESCCRCSGLFKTLSSQPQFYNNNADNNNSCLFTDGMIISRKVPVYRDDIYNHLDSPFFLDFLTSPAPIASQYKKSPNYSEKKLKSVLKERIRRILVECINRDYDTIILGAYGCGAFGNDIDYVFTVFKDFLVKEKYKNYFEKVVFAIFSPKNTKPFDIFYEKFKIKPIIK